MGYLVAAYAIGRTDAASWKDVVEDRNACVLSEFPLIAVDGAAELPSVLLSGTPQRDATVRIRDGPIV